MAQTAIQELLEKSNHMIEDNKKYNSQFHKGLRHGFGMVKEAGEKILLDAEKQQIMDAWIAGREFGCKHDDPKTAEEYYEKTYKK